MNSDLEHITARRHAPRANIGDMSLPASALSLVKIERVDTRPRVIIKETFALIQARPNETLGYGIVLAALTMGLNGLVQFALQALISIGVIGGVGLMEFHEMAGMSLIFGICAVGLLLMTSIAFAIQAITMGGYQLLWLKMLRKQEMTLDDARLVTPSIPALVSAALLSSLAIALGSVALLLPGMMLMLGFTLHPFFIIDKNLGAVESLKASWGATKGHKKNVLLLLLFMLVAHTLGVLACGLGLFISYPLSLGCLATYYNRIATPGYGYMPNGQAAPAALIQDLS